MVDPESQCPRQFRPLSGGHVGVAPGQLAVWHCWGQGLHLMLPCLCVMVSLCECVCVCVRACVRACVCVCVTYIIFKTSREQIAAMLHFWMCVDWALTSSSLISSSSSFLFFIFLSWLGIAIIPIVLDLVLPSSVELHRPTLNNADISYLS